MDTSRSTLYLLVGYPGSGKTTTSQIIHELTGAVHIWADRERRTMFGEPTHGASESHILYGYLNRMTKLILNNGQSVIYDTNFNFRKDRDLLRQMADEHSANTVLIWIKLSKPLARKRAMTELHATDNSYPDTMTVEDFNRITSHLEAPTPDENPIILDGSLLTPEYVAAQLKLPSHRPVKPIPTP